MCERWDAGYFMAAAGWNIWIFSMILSILAVSYTHLVSADVYVQFMGRELLTKEIVANVKKAWAGMTGKKEEDIKELQVYVKPEENKAYYVVNGEADGNYIDL